MKSTSRGRGGEPGAECGGRDPAGAGAGGSREADRRRAAGALLSPIDGIPFSVKDSIEVAGCVCTAGTIGRRHAPPSGRDATLVARLRAAGAIPIARTNLPDLLFAFESDNLIHGRTNNPFDVSSGRRIERRRGGADRRGRISIRAGQRCRGKRKAPGALLRDRGAEAHLGPAACNRPDTAGGWRLEAVWQIGPMARQVEDLCALMPILLGGDGEDHTVIEMPYEGVGGNGRVAFFTDNGIAAPDAETRQ